MIILNRESLVTIEVIYFIPDYANILNTFWWQTMDVRPKYPRINRFLDYWRKEVDAVIKDIIICDSISPKAKWRNGILFPVIDA